MGKSRVQAFFTGDPTGGSVARDRWSVERYREMGMELSVDE